MKLIQKLSYSLLFILSLLIIALLLKKCNTEPIIAVNTVDSANIYKSEINALKDSIKHLDTTRVKLVTKYRYLKGKTDTIPCDTLINMIVNVCDTIILNDSIEISKLKQINTKYSYIIKHDSIAIDSLKSSRKKYFKGFKHGLIVGSIGGAILIGALVR